MILVIWTIAWITRVVAASGDGIQVYNDVQNNSTFLSDRDTPAVLRGAAIHWTAIKEWSHEYLSQKLLNVSFAQGVGLDEIVSNPNHYIFVKIHSKTGRLILNTDDEDLEDSFTPLDDADSLSPLFDSWQARRVHRFLLIGGNGSGLSFHKHQYGAWNGLIRGKKRWFLYPPNVDTLAIDPDGYPSWWKDDTAEGRRQFATSIVPRLLQRPLECLQETGDVLFVPPLWSHMVINEGPLVAAVNAIHDRSNNFYYGSRSSL
jgi:hypothetical protein